jgi:hypothetical protein
VLHSKLGKKGTKKESETNKEWGGKQTKIEKDERVSNFLLRLNKSRKIYKFWSENLKKRGHL